MAGNNWFDRNCYVLLALFFFASGFLSLLYQTVWLRLAFAHFGVITPVISVVVSVFMLGLGIGSFFGGRYISIWRRRTGFSAIGFYGIAEMVIAAGSILVPSAYEFSQQFLLTGDEISSLQYLFFSACAIAIAILPFAIAMGATFPCAMAYLQELEIPDKRSFGYLYLANVAGAVAGVLATVFVFIELFGFHHTLLVAGVINLGVSATAICWAVSRGKQNLEEESQPAASKRSITVNRIAFFGLVLFASGFASMAMEIVWTRSFMPILGNLVYSFAKLLAVYLFSTCCGTFLYRLQARKNSILPMERLLCWTVLFSLLPIVLNDPRWNPADRPMLALLSIAPFCAALGYLTPLIVDEYSEGSASVAGFAYAINVLGGILGPLVAGYWLLPILGVKLSLLVLSLPLMILAGAAAVKHRAIDAGALVAASACLAVFGYSCYGYEDGILFSTHAPAMIHRDYAATTIAIGRGLDKRLVVNGSNMTGLVLEPKYMADLPLAFHKQPCKSALIICFGMGSTYRTMLSWGVKTTAVELVPGVRDSFPFFRSDAEEVLRNPKGRIVVDDGRRFLKRTKEKFDIITIDPPPPVEAAGSSLLYSQEFYSLIKEHLNPGGILQQWYPYEDATLHAAARSLKESFPYIKVFRSVQMNGYHFLCSLSPIDNLTAAEMIKRLPPQAMADLQEPVLGKDASRNIPSEIAGLLSAELDIDKLVSPNPRTKITDDLPYNEYYWLRTTYPAR